MSTKKRERGASVGDLLQPPSGEAVGRLRPHLKPASVVAVGQSFNNLRAELDAAKGALEAKGEQVLEIDPALIDPSFAHDRMVAFDPEGADAEFVAAIKDQGQLVPSLLRRNPDSPGRFQPAYGRRRIAAAAFLGRKVRALVRDLSDEQLVVAQGQENEARNGLTFIEKCRFAATLEAQGFKRKVIESALNVAQPNLSSMLQVVERVPGAVIDWIGPAPEIGRPRWLMMAQVADLPSVRAKMVAVIEVAISPDITSSDGRFGVVMKAANERSAATKPAPSLWALPGRKRPYGSLDVTPRRVILTIDRSANPAFADELLERVEKIRREIEGATATIQPKKG